MSLPEGWFRAEPDSSTIQAPRLLARHFVHPDDLDRQIAFYERAFGVRCDARTPIPEARLELATVGNLLLIGNPRQAGETALATAYTLLVASVAEYVVHLDGTGTELTEPVSTGRTGSRARVRYPDGTLVELLDYRPLPEELDTPSGSG